MEEVGRNKSNGRFEKGYIETSISKLKRSTALREQWKSRPNYLGDIKTEFPRIYNSYRGIRFTDKGKRAGCSEEWLDYRTFFLDVVTTYKKGLVLRRLDTTKPWSKNNFIWCTQEEAQLLKGGLTSLTYKGETLTLRDISIKYEIPLSALKNRYHKHKKDYTIEEIIFGRLVKRKSKSPKDISEVDNIRAKASKMISSYRIKDKKRQLPITDISIEWMIENILKKPCVYCGDTNRIGCDRIDNNLGHTKDNIVPCCYECNVARGDNFSYREMKILGQAIRQIKIDRNGIKANKKVEES